MKSISLLGMFTVSHPIPPSADPKSQPASSNWVWFHAIAALVYQSSRSTPRSSTSPFGILEIWSGSSGPCEFMFLLTSSIAWITIGLVMLPSTST